MEPVLALEFGHRRRSVGSELDELQQSGEIAESLPVLEVWLRAVDLHFFDQIERLQDLAATLVAPGWREDGMTNKPGAARLFPYGPVAPHVFRGGWAAFLPHRLDELAAPLARVHVLGAIFRHGAQRLSQIGLDETVAGLGHVVTGLVQELAALRSSGKILLSACEVVPQQGRDGDTILGVPDGGLKQAGEWQPPEAFLHGFDTSHEPRDQGLAPFCPLRCRRGAD